MGSFDSTTWQAMGLVLTVLGLGISVVLWRRRGPASGIRAVGWSLLPLAAGLTGTLRLIGEIGDSIGSWATRLVFSPVVWLGIMVAGVAAVLLGVSGAMRRHGLGTGARTTEPDALPRKSRAAVKAPKKSLPGPTDDSDDIEAILKKHGIS